jgi:hypothetical protein
MMYFPLIKKSLCLGGEKVDASQMNVDAIFWCSGDAHPIPTHFFQFEFGVYSAQQ